MSYFNAITLVCLVELTVETNFKGMDILEETTLLKLFLLSF